MQTRSTVTLAAAALALAAAASTARASLVVDTGTPAGVGFPLALDGSDYYAGRFSVSQGASVNALAAYITGGTSGETFTLAIYADSASHLPASSPLYATTATMGADGWNGASGLSGWLLAAGSYWEAVEVGASDTLGSGSITGALLPLGAPNAVAKTAFSAGGSYSATSMVESFGLRVDATAVPEPASCLLVFAALPLLRLASRRPAR